jgi:hypothetical protein
VLSSGALTPVNDISIDRTNLHTILCCGNPTSPSNVPKKIPVRTTLSIPEPPVMKATMEAAEWHQPAPANPFGAAETF